MIVCGALYCIIHTGLIEGFNLVLVRRRQTVEICTKKGLITVKKPFRVVRVGLEPLDLATIQLVITYDSSNNCKRNAWYVEPIVDMAAGMKIDWILVDQ